MGHCARVECCYAHSTGRCSDQFLIEGFSDDEEIFNTAEPVVTNPKTLMGQSKAPLGLISPAAEIYEAEAMNYGAFQAPRLDGGKGYGPWNWRDVPVESMIYVHAALRHIKMWVDGEERASDSLAHHLGHARACLGIIIDALENGTLIDDRPKVKTQAASRLLDEFKVRQQQRSEK